MLTMRTNLSEFAFFGGTFDPVHLGHLHLLYQASLLTPFKKVIISPVSINNFKSDKSKPASGQDRINMLSLALEDYKELYPDSHLQFFINDSDIKKGGVSYAYNTILDVKEKYKIDKKLGYFVGDDILPTLNKWYRIDDLLKEVEFFVFTRDFETLPKDVELPIHLINSGVFEQSSTDVRNDKSLNGLSVRVKRYVQNHKLYEA